MVTKEKKVKELTKTEIKKLVQKIYAKNGKALSKLANE